MNFVIFAEGDYSPNGGGSVALHKLAHNIASLGEDVFIYTSRKNPNYLGTQVTLLEATAICQDNNSIAIYPEVTCGNPFKAKKVMRWILYNVRTYGQHGIFGANDLIYKYAPYFSLRFPQQSHGELRANELNLDIFYNKNLERSGDCYLIKKGNNKEHNQHSATAIKLDDYPIRGFGANEYLANVFNTCERFISYDTATWMSIMATQCGCLSIVAPDYGITPEQWRSGYPYFKYGIAYGDTEEEISHSLNTRNLVVPNLLEIEAKTIEQTKEFISRAKSL